MTDAQKGQELLVKYQRATLGVDGNAAYALLGPDLQEGESEFVTLPDKWTSIDEVRAARLALNRLKERLSIEHLPFIFDVSHPYGG